MIILKKKKKKSMIDVASNGVILVEYGFLLAAIISIAVLNPFNSLNEPDYTKIIDKYLII